MLTRNRRFFFAICSTYIIACLVFISLFQKGEELIYFCEKRTDLFSTVFIYTTKLGEWIAIMTLGLYLLIKNRKALISGIIAFVPMDLFMLWLKNFLDYPRPLIYFQHGEIKAVENYPSLFHHSMPSGHSMTAFFVMSYICFLFNISSKYQIILFSFAILVGISRMYLMCHFIEDILLGSIMGITAAILASVIYEKTRWNVK